MIGLIYNNHHEEHEMQLSKVKWNGGKPFFAEQRGDCADADLEVGQILEHLRDEKMSCDSKSGNRSSNRLQFIFNDVFLLLHRVEWKGRMQTHASILVVIAGHHIVNNGLEHVVRIRIVNFDALQRMLR